MKFIDLETQYNLLKDEIDHGINNVLKHGQYIMGPEVKTLESNLSEFVGSKHAIACSSGTDALLMSLMTLGVKRGDVVITTAFTYIATAEVISLLGAIPKFIDIDPKTFNMDIQKLEDILKKDSSIAKYVMPVNIFGAPLDYNHLNKLKQKYNITIIEDAAQSFGAIYHDKISGNLGDISCTSFYPAKPLGCYGDGGAVFTDDDKIAEKLRSIREHGAGKDKYNNVRLGINGRMDTLQAAVLIPKLRIFKNELLKRNSIAQRYSDQIEGKVAIQETLDKSMSSWAQYSILCEDKKHRDDVIRKLKDNNIPTAIYYIIPLHLQEVFSDLEFSSGTLSITEDVCSRILSLPMNPYLTEEEINKVCSLIIGV